MRLFKSLQERIFGTTKSTSAPVLTKSLSQRERENLYSRLALITSITLVSGYILVHATYSVINSTEYQTGAPLTSALLGKVVDNITQVNTDLTTLSGKIGAIGIMGKYCTSNGTQVVCNTDTPSAGGGESLWSTGASSSINYSAWVVWIWSPSGNAELQIKSGTQPHWGIYQSESTEELNFWNGENRMTLAKNGNVGIGTTSPTRELHIFADKYATATIETNGTIGNSVLELRNNQTTINSASIRSVNFLQSDGGSYSQIGDHNGSVAGKSFLTFNTSASERLRINENGNVGIGTTSPGARLHIIDQHWQNSNPMAGWQLRIENVATNGGKWGIHATADGWNAGGWGKLVFFADDNANNSRLVITQNGNVGIGTVSPGANLDVMSTIWTSSIRVKSSNGGAYLNLDTSSSGIFSSQVSFLTDGLSKWAIGGSNIGSAPKDSLSIFNYSTYSNVLTISTGSNVGIGTTAPAYPLDVNGQIRGTNLAVTSDMRFKKDITPIVSALDIVERLQWVTFDWRVGEFKNHNFPGGKQVGFIAQEVEKVLPEVVSTDSEGYKSVSYDKFSAVLVEAVKELKKENDELKARLLKLEQK